VKPEATPRGARRRALLRAVLGGAGSVRRWVVGSLLFLSVCALLFTRGGFVGGIAVFIIASIFVMSAFKARAYLVGDEDEFNAWLLRQSTTEARTPEPRDEPIRLSNAEWEKAQALLKERAYPLGGAPPAPSKDAAGDETPRGSR